MISHAHNGPIKKVALVLPQKAWTGEERAGGLGHRLRGKVSTWTVVSYFGNTNEYMKEGRNRNGKSDRGTSVNKKCTHIVLSDPSSSAAVFATAVSATK
jgi:hypothetical protein